MIFGRISHELRARHIFQDRTDFSSPGVYTHETTTPDLSRTQCSRWWVLTRNSDRFHMGLKYFADIWAKLCPLGPQIVFVSSTANILWAPSSRTSFHELVKDTFRFSLPFHLWKTVCWSTPSPFNFAASSVPSISTERSGRHSARTTKSGVRARKLYFPFFRIWWNSGPHACQMRVWREEPAHVLYKHQ